LLLLLLACLLACLLAAAAAAAAAAAVVVVAAAAAAAAAAADLTHSNKSSVNKDSWQQFAHLASTAYYLYIFVFGMSSASAWASITEQVRAAVYMRPVLFVHVSTRSF
jgi:hypothetical protein